MTNQARRDSSKVPVFDSEKIAAVVHQAFSDFGSSLSAFAKQHEDMRQRVEQDRKRGTRITKHRINL